MSLRVTAALLAIALSLTGCATRYSSDREGRQQQPDAQTPIEPIIEEPARPVILPTTTTAPTEPVRSLPAAIALRDRADSASDAGEHQKAIGLLERALRISPQDPETFISLAQNNLSMEQPQQAIQLARRGLSMNPTQSQRQSLLNIVETAQAAL